MNTPQACGDQTAASNNPDFVDERKWQSKSDDGNILGDAEEQQHLFSILDAFRQYRRLAHLNTTHVRRQNLYALPSSHWQLLAAPPVRILDTLSAIDDAIDANADLAEAVLAAGLDGLGFPLTSSPSRSTPPWHGTATDIDLDKTRSTINQLFRDWSSEGSQERGAVHAPILADLRAHVPLPAVNEHFSTPRDDVHVLVPGAGLGRLVFDLAYAGYAAHGNEVSYHQLLTSSFVLNHTAHAGEYQIYPFVSTFSNHLDRASQLTRIDVPDVHPGSTQLSGSMDMTAGEFAEVYGQIEYKSVFDAVASVFFVDTAPDFIEYVKTVRNCLRDGGLWTNVGPLLWHFDGTKRQPGNRDHTAHPPHQGDQSDSGPTTHDATAEQQVGVEHGHHQQHQHPHNADNNHVPPRLGDRGSVELSADEVMQLLPAFGFEILTYEPSIGEVGYTQNQRSMLKSVYRPCHWAVRKTPTQEAATASDQS